MNDIVVDLEVEVNPTEDSAKVKSAIGNLFLPSSTEFLSYHTSNLFKIKIVGKEGLMRFYTLLRQEQILSTTRTVLTKGILNETVIFFLNKQAAYMKRISFCDSISKSPLGAIRVAIKSNDLQALIDWLAPRTRSN